ncbi:MAG TPA: DNA-processing protein DprA [Chloroflexota bacterium]|nr:DNA-processing protein DprA [Chloroflexota bacterium]
MHSAGAAYWIAFSTVDGFGPAKARRLFDRFGSLRHAWGQNADALVQAGIDGPTAQRFLKARQTLDLTHELARLDRAEVQAITWDDEARYPRLLRHIASPPVVLYVRGELLPRDELAVAVVGTRLPSPYGRTVAQKLAGELAAKGVTVVSGLARGIDAEAHRAALTAGGRTIAVLGSGLDVMYPREHAGLAREVAGSGSVISEYPLGAKPDAVHFPARNRIVSGLSLGTIVIEAGDTSGALITARFAGEQGRDIFAVPGSIFSKQSLGVHRLIQDGAKLVATVQDVLDELNLGMVAHQLEMPVTSEPDDPLEAALLAALSSEPRHIDDVARATNLPVAQVSSGLTMMELRGLVRQVGALGYAIAN